MRFKKNADFVYHSIYLITFSVVSNEFNNQPKYHEQLVLNSKLKT